MDYQRQKGFSLIELMLVLAVMAALSVAAFFIYSKVQVARTANQTSEMLTQAQASLKGVFVSEKYNELTTAVAVAGKFFPSQMTSSATTLKNQWNGAVTINGSDARGAPMASGVARHFAITYEAVPEDVCKRLVPSAALNFGRVVIGSTPVFDQLTDAKMDISEALVVSACTGNPTIVFCWQMMLVEMDE